MPPLRFLATTATVPTATAGAGTLAAFLPASHAMRALRNLPAADAAVPAASSARCFLALLRRMLRTAIPFGYPAHRAANGRGGGRRSGGGHDRAQPVGRLADALAHADPGLPAQQALGLLDARPAAHDVDRVGRQVLEREGLRVAPAGLPDDPRDLGDGHLLAGRDVEVLVQPRVRRHGRDDAVGDVVDV